MEEPPTLRVITLVMEELPTLRVTLFMEELPTLRVTLRVNLESRVQSLESRV